MIYEVRHKGADEYNVPPSLSVLGDVTVCYMMFEGVDLVYVGGYRYRGENKRTRFAAFKGPIQLRSDCDVAFDPHEVWGKWWSDEEL